MNLLNPGALAWAALALPIIGLYVLRIRRRRQQVPTLMFWDRIFEETAPRSLWRRLRHWISLLAQLSILALLVAALSDPVSSGTSNQPKHWVLIMDQSASMSATDGEPTRFDKAKRLASRVIRGMRSQDEATIIAAGASVTIACGRTHHQPTLHEAIDGLAVQAVSVNLKRALRLAKSSGSQVEGRHIVLITDGPGAALVQDETNHDKIQVYQCGRNGSNVAITGFAVRQRLDNPLELQGMLRVANFGDEPVKTEIALTRDELLMDVILMDLAPGQESVKTFEQLHDGGRVLRAELKADDALALDNVAFAVLPEIREKHVVLVSPGNIFLRSVLEAHPWMRVSVIPSPNSSELTQSADLMIYDGVVPDKMPDVPALFIHPNRESPLWRIGSEIESPIISDVEDDAPLLRHVHLRNCTFHRARTIITKRPAQILVSSFEHPLLMQWIDQGPRIILLALDIDVAASDLPWRTAFPILMQNVLNDLSGIANDPVSAYPTGQVVSLQWPTEASEAKDEQGRLVPTQIERDELQIGPVTHVGLVTVKGSTRETILAFNLANFDESNIRSAMGEQSHDTEEMWATIPGSNLPWWVMLVIATIGLSTLEWGLHQRRKID